MAMGVVVEDERILYRYRRVSIFPLVDSHTEVSILCDSGSNAHSKLYV